MRVLIAEDNPVNRELLYEILAPLGYEIIQAENGVAALTQIQTTHPDLVLLDISMPVLDGFAVIDGIRGILCLHHLPVIAITAYAMKDDREKIMAAGFSSYISKPIDPAMLLQEMQRLMVEQDN